MVRARAAAPRSPQLAWFITGALFLLVGALSILIATRTDTPFGKWPLALAFLALFGAAEITVLRFEVKRQMFSVSLTEIPLLLALMYLPPLTVVVARLVAAVLSQLWLRVPSVKLAFNAATFTTGTTIASLVVVTHPGLSADQPDTWLVLAMAVTLGMLTTLAAVVGVVTLVQGRISRADLIRTTVSCLVVAEINVVIGLVVLLVVGRTPWALILLVGLAVV